VGAPFVRSGGAHGGTPLQFAPGIFVPVTERFAVSAQFQFGELHHRPAFLMSKVKEQALLPAVAGLLDDDARMMAHIIVARPGAVGRVQNSVVVLPLVDAVG